MPVSVDELNQSATPCYSAQAVKAGLSPRKLINELKLIAFSDIANHFDIAEGGELQFRTLDKQKQKRRAIKSIKEKTVITETKDGALVSKTSTVEVQLYDKLDAIKAAMSIHGMQKPKEVKLSGALEITDADISEEEREAIMQASRLMREKINAKSRKKDKPKNRARKG